MRQEKQYLEKLLSEYDVYDLDHVRRTEGPTENVTSQRIKRFPQKDENWHGSKTIWDNK